MDGQRFDAMARAMATGSTRRRALRLAGGAVAGSLLAAAGLGRRAGAQDGPPCGDLFARCRERGEAACGPPPDNSNLNPVWWACLSQEVPGCRQWFQTCNEACEYIGGCGQAGCPGDQVCERAETPGGSLQCRCISPT